ncbi:MAG: aspartate carbamoyltransferase [Oscillospiraceae bacterium]
MSENSKTCKHVIDLSEIPADKCNKIISLANDIIENPKAFSKRLEGKILATLFYEPSTRTQMSFQTAMYRLGGQVIGFDNPANSSVSKGENIKDTARIISGYADAIVVRHPKEGAARAFALEAGVSVINAGDGGHLHPTQTLTDLVTMSHEIGRLDNLTLGFCGDLKNGRTVHSLIKFMVRYKTNKFVLVSTKELQIPEYIKLILDKSGCQYKMAKTLEEVMPELDVLYMTRIQRERFLSEEDYLKQSANYILDVEKMALGKASLKVLHPLPRVDEIDYAVDDDPRSAYFKQAVYGMYGRMALLVTLLEDDDFSKDCTTNISLPKKKCLNPNCISNCEEYLTKYNYILDEKAYCEYCDHIID